METRKSRYCRFTCVQRRVPAAILCVLLVLAGRSATRATTPDPGRAPTDTQAMGQLEQLKKTLDEVGAKLTALDSRIKRPDPNSQVFSQFRAGIYELRLELAGLGRTLAEQARNLAVADPNDPDLALADLNEQLADLNWELALAQVQLHQQSAEPIPGDEPRWQKARGIIRELQVKEKELTKQRVATLESAIRALHRLGLGRPPKVQAAPGGDGGLPLFEWPPPRVSAWAVISRDSFAPLPADPCLGHIDIKLCSALKDCGYVDLSYFAVPEGFALVTRMEHINEDGTPKEPKTRFETQPPESFKLPFRDYLRSLFLARPGYYRIIVFVVTTTLITQSPKRIDSKEAEAWFSRGGNILPPAIALKPWTGNHNCTALIYEFAQPNPGVPADLTTGRGLQCRDHLKAAGLWQRLEGKP